MGTLRHAVSTVRSRHKLLSSDNLITDRVVASELRAAADLLIKRDTDLRKLWGSDSIFTTIPCVELIEVPISECCDYRSSKTIRRSKYKIPRLGEGAYSYILYVYNIETSRRILEITPNRYINYLKLRPQSKEIYFWIENEYLYITNEDIALVKLRGYFEDGVTTMVQDKNCESCPCNKYGSTDNCVNPLDQTFKCPQYLLKAVFDMVSQSLLTSYSRSLEDSTPNEKEDYEGSGRLPIGK